MQQTMQESAKQAEPRPTSAGPARARRARRARRGMGKAALGFGAVAMTATGVLATTAAPAAADGENLDDWNWSGNHFDGIARIRYIEKYRMNVSDNAGLPDNLDIYGSTCVTVPYTIGRVEMTQSYEIDLVELGGISIGVGIPGWGVAPGTNTVINTWSFDKPAWDGVQTEWSKCSSYAKATAFGNGDFGNPGRVHVTTNWNGRMVAVRHKVQLHYYSQHGQLRFAPQTGESRGPWWNW